MLRVIYNALWWIIAPVAVLRLLIRSRRERGYREHIGERFGYCGRMASMQSLSLSPMPTTVRRVRGAAGSRTSWWKW